METERTNNRVIVGVAVVSMVLLVVTLVWLEDVFTVYTNYEIERKVLRWENPARLTLAAQEDSVLNGYRWVDRPTGKVGIPIERAMDLVVNERARGQGGD